MGRSHTHRVRVRYGECDPSGVVFNAHYFAYFDLALTELWREAAGGYGAMMEEGVDLQVVEATARYKAPARFDDELEVFIRTASIGRSSWHWEFAVHHCESVELLARAEQVMVLIERAARAPVPVPADMRDAVEAFEGGV